MSEPTVFILHGDDEYAIRQHAARIAGKLGDENTAKMNTDHFDGNKWDANAVLAATRAMPFLAKNRLVVLTNPLGGIRTKKGREELLHILESAPASSLIVLQIFRPLVSWQDRKRNKTHWLENWAKKSAGKALVREYTQPRGQALTAWIVRTAAEKGGEISPAAAEVLASLVDGDPRVAAKELEKVLTYVNFARMADETDVETLVASEEQGNIFELVDAIGGRNRRKAIHLLRQLLETEDPFMLFGMIVRQFRLLMLVKEAIQQGYGRNGEIAKAIGEREFTVRKLAPQARNFTREQLRTIYHRLLDIDSAVKRSEISWPVALDLFVSGLTAGG